MKHASLKALVPVSTDPFCGVTMYSPCTFPKYYLHNTAAEADVANPVLRHLYGANKRSHRRHQQGMLNPDSSRRNPVAQGERARVKERAVLPDWLVDHRNVYLFCGIVVPIILYLRLLIDSLYS